MPPKKDSKEPEKVLLMGRMGTNLKVGIVGVPNVGFVSNCSDSSQLKLILNLTFRKSTFFNVLTKSEAAAENFPFCTIDPNENKYLFRGSA